MNAAVTSAHGVIESSQAGRVLIATSAALLMCLFLSPRFIDLLRNRRLGQNIREEGPEGHKVKAGTPTMGGIIIVISFAVPYLCLSTRDWASIGVFGATLACAFVGFADDYMKIVRRRSLGLRGRTKMVLLFLISVGLWWIATHKAGMPQSVSLRPIHAHVYLGSPAYIIFIYLVFAGTTNAVNLTDGLDGLAAGCGAIALLAYVGITFVTTSANSHDLELVAGCMCGACIGFLWFNSFPASVFMGDTGSLAIGGAVAAMAVMTNTEILLVIIGGIFVLEALSVLAQARLQDGADPPSLRVGGVVGDEDHAPLLDRRGSLWRHRLHALPGLRCQACEERSGSCHVAGSIGAAELASRHQELDVEVPEKRHRAADVEVRPDASAPCSSTNRSAARASA
jgi:phospho-N-acetylmuramoyl-pentapeptide-transferase